MTIKNGQNQRIYKMIEIEKNYKITLNEEQAMILYNILNITDKDRRLGLNVLLDELRTNLNTGIR